MERGVAFNEDGRTMSGMGAAAADYQHTGWQSIFRTNFSDERETLYRNNGKGEFEDVTVGAGLAMNTRYVGWGCGFGDFDNDGWVDLFLVNGHAFPEVDRLKIDIHHKQRPILYRNLRNGKFLDISDSAGPGLREAFASRGAAVGDFRNNGRLAILINNQNSTPALLEQPGESKNHWITLALQGTRSNRSAVGAKVSVVSGGTIQTDEVRSGGSYLSQSDLRLHFGLGDTETIDRINVIWPSGAKSELKNIKADRVLRIVE